MTHALQGIFYIRGNAGDWLYMVRADVADADDAKRKALQLAKREGRAVNVRIEDWNHPQSDADGFTFNTED